MHEKTSMNYEMGGTILCMYHRKYIIYMLDKNTSLTQPQLDGGGSCGVGSSVDPTHGLLGRPLYSQWLLVGISARCSSSRRVSSGHCQCP